MFVAGIDIGSVAAKAVIWDTEKQCIAGRALQPSGWNTKEAGAQVFTTACAQAKVDIDDVKAVVGTGYGRIALPMADKIVTEITCHAKGASYLFPKTGIVLDIGGQDSKVISVDSDGAVQDFLMNDKCAAGTGRFLQVLSGILGMDLVELGEAASHGQAASISSMCAVFAETEIIGLLAQGTPPANIAAGVFLSIARRMRALAGRIPMRGECTFTGGLATSPAFAKLLAEELQVAVNVPEEPQIVGALGAALLAEKQANKIK